MSCNIFPDLVVSTALPSEDVDTQNHQPFPLNCHQMMIFCWSHHHVPSKYQQSLRKFPTTNTIVKLYFTVN